MSLPHQRRQRPPTERPLVGVFRGGLDAALRGPSGERVSHKNKLRRWLHSKLEGEPGFVFSGKKSKSYVDEMDSSRFCIIPRGNTPW